MRHGVSLKEEEGAEVLAPGDPPLLQVMGAYYSSVASPESRGATFLAVCRGKVSSRVWAPHSPCPHPQELRTWPPPLGPTSSRRESGGSPWPWQGLAGVGRDRTNGEFQQRDEWPGVLEAWTPARAWPTVGGLAPACLHWERVAVRVWADPGEGRQARVGLWAETTIPRPARGWTSRM